MNNIDAIEKANFKTLIETDGQDRIQDRLNIIDIFLGTEEHVTIEEMYCLLKDSGHDYDADFIRQCMNRMVDLGFAQKKQFEGQPIRYEHRHLGKHHDHLICTKCGKIIEFADQDIERLQIAISTELGFHMLQHRMEIYGLCSVCLSQRKHLVPLGKAKPGEKVVIREIGGGKRMKGRLASMGLRIGDHIEIINNTGEGRIILGYECTRLALGRGMAQKIMVSMADDDKELICRDEN
jgi:Fur family ferric uptake transcriptional regulator